MMLRILLLSALTAISIAFSPNAALTNTALHRSSLSSTSLKMADEVKVGDKLPSVILKEGQANYETPVDINLLDLIAGKKVAIFAVPGAFTPGMFCLGNAVFCLGNVTGIVDSQSFTKKSLTTTKAAQNRICQVSSLRRKS